MSYYEDDREERYEREKLAKQKAKKKIMGGVTTAIIIFVALIGFRICTEKIQAGYVGVVYSMNGGVSGELLQQGWHIVSPTKKVTTYSIGLEQESINGKDDLFKIPTSDGKTITVDLEYSYRFDESQLSNTFIQFKSQSGEHINKTFIKSKIKAWTQEVSARYPVTDIFGDKRPELNDKVASHLREKFAPYGIIIDNVNFTDINVDDETTAAIQKKVTAQQELELANIEAKTSKVQAEKDKEVALIAAQQEKEKAQIEAEQTLIKAEGDAKAKTVRAEADAAANHKIAQSLTPELIQKMKIDKWKGEVPQVEGTNSTIVKLPE